MAGQRPVHLQVKEVGQVIYCSERSDFISTSLRIPDVCLSFLFQLRIVSTVRPCSHGSKACAADAV